MSTEYASRLGAIMGMEQGYQSCANMADRMANEADARGAAEGAVHLRAFANAVRSNTEKWFVEAKEQLDKDFPS